MTDEFWNKNLAAFTSGEETTNLRLLIYMFCRTLQVRCCKDNENFSLLYYYFH